jgi:hypothetical protein
MRQAVFDGSVRRGMMRAVAWMACATCGVDFSAHLSRNATRFCSVECRYGYMKTRRGFMSRVRVTESCWLWTGSTSGDGYGRVRIDGRLRNAHRHSYEMFRGQILEGLQIDHLCRVRLCVNPKHLEAVSGATNTHRGNMPQQVAFRKRLATGTCKRGHSSAIFWNEKYGYCRECQREDAAARRRAEGAV